ncbi:MAG: HAD family hydrolase [Desulfatiglandales bacterium]
MKDIKAIGFDLFNTLITVKPATLDQSNRRMVESLQGDGFPIHEQTFRKAHKEAALRFVEECRKDGRETHNRFWISAALETEGFHIPPDDGRISNAVEAYFSAFYEFCRLIPGTDEMLKTLKKRYRLGLLSNFTHGPAARKIIDQLGLRPFFETILISGELGYRKPHHRVFEELLHHLQVENHNMLYVGDDFGPDISGAIQAGIIPVWMSYVTDQGLFSYSGIPAGGEESPEPDILRISNWMEFLALLDKV